MPGGNFEAFCLDHFPEVKQQFVSGQDRTYRETLLLEKVPAAEVAARLGEQTGDEKYKHLLRY